jgi:hypothetical protein
VAVCCHPGHLVSTCQLIRFFKAEDRCYLEILHFSKATFGRNSFWLLGISVIGMTIMAAPMASLVVALIGDSTLVIKAKRL